jgi:hypothetical protein
MADMVGQVSAERYAQVVERGRDLVGTITSCQFELGDLALEIEPMGPWGGSIPGSGEQVGASLAMFAADLSIPVATVERYRWTASRWPRDHRAAGVGFTVHKILASITDEDRRFAVIADPPVDVRTGVRRWSDDAAKRVVGQPVTHPATPAEKVSAITMLARDERVADAAATDLLRRPEVAFKVMADSAARHIVNQAQIDHATQAYEAATAKLAEQLDAEPAEAPVPMKTPSGDGGAVPAPGPASAAALLVELSGVAAGFGAAATRLVPQLRGRRWSEADRQMMAGQLHRLRAAADWIEHALAAGDVDLDDQLAALLRGA